MEKETKGFNIRKLPASLHLLIKRRAVDSGISMEKYIIEALKKVIK